MMEHSKRCLQLQEELKKFEELWPNYCKKCGALGVIEYAMHVYRDGSADPAGADPCICLESGICPRCGDNNLHFLYRNGSDWGYCHVCGWDEHAICYMYGESAKMVAPTFDCECWIDDLVEDTLRRVDDVPDGLDTHMQEMIKHDPNPVMFEFGAWWFMDELWVETYGPYEYRSGAEQALDWYAARLEFKNGQQIFYGGDELGNPIYRVSTKMYYHWERYSEPNAIFVGDDIDQGWDYKD